MHTTAARRIMDQLLVMGNRKCAIRLPSYGRRLGRGVGEKVPDFRIIPLGHDTAQGTRYHQRRDISRKRLQTADLRDNPPPRLPLRETPPWRPRTSRRKPTALRLAPRT